MDNYNLRQTDTSDALLFKSESILEERKWGGDPFKQDQDFGYQSSRRSSNGGFFHGKIKQASKKGKKSENDMQFTASIDLFEQKLRIKLDDSHRQGANLAGREILHDFGLRDILSARQDEEDGKIMHLWTFKRHKLAKKCCGSKSRYIRKLEDFQLVGESDKKTREWCIIIQNAAEGAPQSDGKHKKIVLIFLIEFPKKRRVLVLVNPFSGRRLAARMWEIARPILEKAHIDMKIVMTERAGHAYDMVNLEIKQGDYDGIVTVSGDGLIHEVVNGLYRRQDRLQLMSTLSLGFIPGGSANGLVKAVLSYAEEEYSVLNATFLIAKGRQMKMDLTEIEGEYQKEKIYSFLSLFWAILADCDINSEVFRCLGPARFTIWGIYRIMCTKRYAGSIYYTGQQLRSKHDLNSLNEDEFSPDLPELSEEPVRHEENPDEYCFRNLQFSHVLIQNTPYIGSSLHTGPLSTLNDGYNDMITQTIQAGKCALGKILIDEDSGAYFDKRGNIKPSLHIKYTKCKAWRIDPLVKGPRPENNNNGIPESTPLTRNESLDPNRNALQEESKESGQIQSSKNSDMNFNKSGDANKIYRYSQDAIFSIDGEKYPAQKVQGRVLKSALPIYC
ncbi:UNKNOWN [Stylonychia lemnae]|uniref:DAGKc domain-containing protein n=1 Tax=Stylonychia lemnae TaxID=5949 RepID=A0A078B9J3_STYLE|nr:UNKNOWN [Stylonychia lemnae]|eukprot:CDW91094.1 UNKNOWN [Stylonychia lemnae]